ncbi:sodium channel protein Nach-like isoform X1 [Tribolium castaneum]|uniref:sodium channel protein Nach-like isoform X1 n=1 Tax=Tribolium castaneum TaxID=7070 RepID=UPI0030FE9A05
MKTQFFNLIQNFAKQTTIHGLHIIGIPKLHVLERIFWVLVVTMAAGGAIAITYSNWMRYLANPTVVSIQKDFRNWLNPFPAVTGCFVDKTDKKKADKYIQEKWGINSSDPKYAYYMDFIKIVSNITYKNLGQLDKFVTDPKLQNIDLTDLTAKVHPDLSGTLVTFDTKHKTKWDLIMSELGMCFSVNSLFVDLLTLNPNKTSVVTQRILRCHYLNGLCYARYDSDPDLPIKYYTHSYLEVAHATIDPPLIVHESEELEINYRMQETESSLALRDLSPLQRKCRFYDEPISDELPVYSSSLCYMECRYKLALKLCGCRPIFYHNFGGKVCDIKGHLCLAQHSDYITKRPSQIGCDCPQPCDIIIYFPQVPKFTKWEYGYFEQRMTFRWALLAPTTKLHRDVLFGFEDLVVSFGGTLALFLGISFISAIEFVFLLVENIYVLYKNQRKTNVVVVGPFRKIHHF